MWKFRPTDNTSLPQVINLSSILITYQSLKRNLIIWLIQGVYKPRVKCFDVTQYSMKFERCFDSECVKFRIISDDYSKVWKRARLQSINRLVILIWLCICVCVWQLVFLHNDRYVEFHAQYGKYYKIRIPKFGRDFDYHFSSCDLYFVGARLLYYDTLMLINVWDWTK